MIEGIKDWFGDAKDTLVSSGAKAFANHEIARFGEFTRLEIDSKAKIIQATVLLNEEQCPIEISIGGYSLYERDGKACAQLVSFSSSKAWLTEIANGLLVGTELRLPRKWPMPLVSNGPRSGAFSISATSSIFVDTSATWKRWFYGTSAQPGVWTFFEDATS